nr:hypothetical protein Iba_chr04bCG1860 [Ipomoea batatas]
MENPLFDDGLDKKRKRAEMSTNAPIDVGTETGEARMKEPQRGFMKPKEERDFYIQRNANGENLMKGTKPNYLDNNPMVRFVNAEEFKPAKGGNKSENEGAKNQRTMEASTIPICGNASMNAEKGKPVGADQLEEKRKLENNPSKEQWNKGVTVMENPLFDDGLEKRKRAEMSTNAPIDVGTETGEARMKEPQRGFMKPKEERDFYIQRNANGENLMKGTKPNYLDNNPMVRFVNAEEFKPAKGGNKSENEGAKNQRTMEASTIPICGNASMNAEKGKPVGAGRPKHQIFAKGNNTNAADEGKKDKDVGEAVAKQQIPTNAMDYAAYAKSAYYVGESSKNVGEGEKKKRESKESSDEDEPVKQSNSFGLLDEWGGKEKADMDPGDKKQGLGRQNDKRKDREMREEGEYVEGLTEGNRKAFWRDFQKLFQIGEKLADDRKITKQRGFRI